MSYRNDDTGKVEHRYHLQELKYSWFYRGLRWKDMTTLVYGMGDVYTSSIVYWDEKKAREHLKNLKQPVPADEVIATHP